MRDHMVFVFLFLTSLSVVISGSIHVATNGLISLFVPEQYSIVYLYCIILIQPFADVHLGWFHVLATVSSAAVNTGARGSFQIMFVFFFWIYAQKWDCPARFLNTNDRLVSVLDE